MVTSVAAELAARDVHVKGVDELKRWDMASMAAKWATLFEEGLLDETKRGVDGETDEGSRRAWED